VRHSLLRGALACLLLTPVLGGCVLPPSGAASPPTVEVIPADARALVYGRSAREVLEDPQLRDKVRALFGADWGPPTPGGAGKLTLAAPQYFELGGPLRMVRIGAANYIAITGCAPQACAGRRGLLLIREGGEELMARLDDGGFSHHHAYGPGVVGGPGGAGVVLESTLRALERASGGTAFPRPAP